MHSPTCSPPCSPTLTPSLSLSPSCSLRALAHSFSPSVSHLLSWLQVTSQLLREDIFTPPCYRGLCGYRLPKSVSHLGVSISTKEVLVSHPPACKSPPPKKLTGSASWTLVQLLLWFLLGFLLGVSGCVCYLFPGYVYPTITDVYHHSWLFT